MSLRAGAQFGEWAKQLLRDRGGVAALEFALIVPLLLCLYLVTMEVAQAIDANKKVGRVGSLVADLVTQQQAMSKVEVNAIMGIGEATLQPYSRSQPTITVTAIQVAEDTTSKVVWSRKLVDGVAQAGYAKDAPVIDLPTTLKIKGSFLIRVQSALEYEPVITWAASGKSTLGLTSAFDGISMEEVYYLRPRMSTTIPCDSCYDP